MWPDDEHSSSMISVILNDCAYSDVIVHAYLLCVYIFFLHILYYEYVINVYIIQWHFIQNSKLVTFKILYFIIPSAKYWPFCSGLNALTHWAKTKWSSFSRQHFQMHFLEWKCINFNQDFTEVCFQWSNWPCSSIGSDNGLAETRRQAISWTNDGQFTDAYMCQMASMS